MVASSIRTLSSPGDDDNAKRRQILEGARQVFMDLGFDGASMGEIARAAGVSKGTLYVYFTDKSRLFEAIVEQECVAQAAYAHGLDLADGDISDALVRYGIDYMQLLGRPQGGSAVRTVMAIAERMPDVGRRYYEHVPLAWIHKLAAYLDRRVQSRELAIEDCELAASQFILACQATLFLPFVFQAAPPPSAEDIERVVRSAARMFLAAYAPKQESVRR